MSRTHVSWQFLFFITILLSFHISVTPALALPPCLTADPLLPNTTLRNPGSTGEETFAVNLSEPGVFVIETSTVTANQPSPTVALEAHTCAASASMNLMTLYQTPTELALRVSGPGVFFVSVAPQDPNATPVTYKLRSTFVGDPQAPAVLIQPNVEPPSSCTASGLPNVDMIDGTTRCAEVEENTDPWDCDIISGGFPSGIIVVEGEGVALEASIYAEDDCQHQLTEGILGGYGSVIAAPVLAGEHRLAVESAGATGAYTLRLDHFPICLFGEQDDHSDSVLCATALEPGTTAQGTIDNPDTDDEDSFYFRLDAQQTVAVDLQAAAGIYCLLYDDRGQRLTTAQECGPSTLNRTLGAGLYRVKVMGSSSGSHAYTLDLGIVGGS